MSIKKFVLVVGTVLLMAGCGSSVKLDSTPVEDRSTGGTTATDNSVVAKSAVAAVDAGKSAQSGIPSASRLVYFDYDSFVIKPEFQSLIETHAGFIKSDKSR
jgi:peptidoglycan-associated lipoprotein